MQCGSYLCLILLWLIHRDKLHINCDLSLSVLVKGATACFFLTGNANTDKGNRLLCLISTGPLLPSWSSFTAFLLLNVQDSVTAGACVVHILKVFQEERNQAAAQD